MFSGIAGLIQAYSWLIWSITGLFTAFVFYRSYRDEISFWLTDLKYNLPWPGPMSRMASDPSPSSEPGWLNVERTLCSDYHQHIRPITEWEFNNHLAYLKKSYDLGRRPLPMWLWLFLGLLIIAEGLGFAWLLGAQMAMEGSANIQTVLMIAIVLVISGILMWVTHAAGHQLYRTGLLNSCLRQFKLRHGKILSTRLISLDEDQSIDDSDEEVSQCVSRIKKRPGDNGGYVWVIVAAIAIISIGVGSTWMRFAHFDAVRISDTSEPSNPYALSNSQLPDEVVLPQVAADEKADTERDDASSTEAKAAFVMLGFIFVITQIVGIGAGYNFGFAGKQSWQAWHDTQSHAHYAGYWSRFERRINSAQASLQRLQQKMQEKTDHDRPQYKKFPDYVAEQKRNRDDSAYGEKTRTTSVKPVGETVDHVAHIDSLGDKLEKLKYLAELTDSERATVATALKARKATEAQHIGDQFKDLI